MSNIKIFIGNIKLCNSSINDKKDSLGILYRENVVLYKLSEKKYIALDELNEENLEEYGCFPCYNAAPYSIGELYVDEDSLTPYIKKNNNNLILRKKI